jgi:hypothetical protein
MGEHKTLPSLLRAVGAAGLAGGAALALTSCSLLGIAPTSAATPSAGPTEIFDPSIPTEAPSASPTPTDSPLPTATTVPTTAPKPTAKPTTAPAAGKKQAQPFITAAGWDRGSAVLDVQALIPKTVESGGRCTLTARRGSVTVTATSTAAPGAQDTQCNPMDIPGSRLTSGTWTVTVTYVSARSVGTSASRSVQVAK